MTIRETYLDPLVSFSHASSRIRTGDRLREVRDEASIPIVHHFVRYSARHHVVNRLQTHSYIWISFFSFLVQKPIRTTDKIFYSLEIQNLFFYLKIMDYSWLNN